MTHCDVLTVASRALQTIAWSLGVPPERVLYLPNGAPDNAGAPRDLREVLHLTGLPVLLLYTRYTEFEPERLVAIWRRIIGALPSARLLIVGQALDERTEDRITTAFAGVAESVTRVGWVPKAEVPDYLACADAALFPCDDTLINRCKCSVKLTDLLVAGIPVVAEAVGQNAEYIVDRQSGLLTPPGDNAAMADAAVGLLRDEALRHQLGHNACRRMTDIFSWDALASTLLAAYSASDSP